MTVFQQYDGFNQVIDARYYDSDGNCVGIQLSDNGERAEGDGLPGAKDVDEEDLFDCNDLAPKADMMLTPDIDEDATEAEIEAALINDPIANAIYVNKAELNKKVEGLK